jgi:signal transduction histidine kinase
MALPPVLRYAQWLTCLLLASATLWVSWKTNPHSVTWLLAFYATAVLLIVAWRGASRSPLHRAYSVYLLNLNQYLLAVWALHDIGLGTDPAQSKVYASWAQRFLGVGSIYMPVALLYFTVKFSGAGGRWLSLIERVGWIAATGFAVANVAGWLCPDYFWAGVTWVPALAGGYRYFFYFTTFFVFVGMIVPIIGYRRAATEKRRNEILYFVLGAAPLWFACWCNFLISLRVPLYPAGGLTFLLHAAILSYAVLAHRLFDVRIVIRRAFAYAVCLMILGAVYGGLLLLSWEASHAQIIFVLLAGFVFTALVEWIQKKIDAIFFRAATDRERILEEFARDAKGTLDLDALAANICGVLSRGIKPQNVSLYLKGSGTRATLFCRFDTRYERASWPESLSIPENVAAALRNDRSAQRLHMPQSKSEQVIQLGAGDEALVVPITHMNEDLGCVVLAPKLIDESYTDTDIRFAETVAAHSSIALLNARSYAQLAHLEHMNAQTLESLSIGVLTIDDKGNVLRANAACERIVGAKLPLSHIDEIWPLQPILSSALKRAIAANESLMNQELRLEGIRPLALLVTVKCLGEVERKRLFLIILHDVTDYMLMKSRESLAKTGELVASINHEVRGLLQPIRSQLRKLLELKDADHETCKNGIDRAASILPQKMAAVAALLEGLKDFSRPIELRIQKVDVGKIAASVWDDLTRTAVAADIKLECEISDAARECHADGHWLQQVLFNLLRNSAEATTGRPNPIIFVGCRRLPEGFEIEVRDNGCGMDDFALAKLFDPFYTTKGEKGTGLGLAISRKVVELHGGSIRVTSKPGSGTSFVVSLPNRTQDQLLLKS